MKQKFRHTHYRGCGRNLNKSSEILGLLAHMDQMRMDPKHQFAAQYVLSRAANERREREALLAAAAMNMSHLVNFRMFFSPSNFNF